MNIYGALNIQDSQSSMQLNTIDVSVTYEAVQRVLDEINADLAAARALFVDRTTDQHKTLYKLPGGGYMQETTRTTAPLATKPTGEWDAEFPLKQFADQLAWDDVSYAYMTVEDLDRAIKSIETRNQNSLRREILVAMLNNTTRQVRDERVGTLNVRPLANGDTVKYPPVPGTDTEATRDHFAVSNYVASAISDANNPWDIINPALTAPFGGPVSGGDPIITLCNSTHRKKIEELTAFKEVKDRYVEYNSLSDKAVQIALNAPGSYIGRVEGRAFVHAWDWLPANYFLSIHLEAEKPLWKRSDKAATGLPAELALVGNQNSHHPFEQAFFRHRFGLGVANRLNGHVLQLKASGTYDIPAGFTE